MMAGAIIFASCNKDDDNPSGGDNPASSYFKAKIDGNEFNASTYGGEIDEDGVLYVGGLSGKSLMTLAVANFDGEGTYNFSGLQNGAAYYAPDTSDFFNAYSTLGENGMGTVVVTSWNSTDSLISGTFNFEADHAMDGTSISVTNGEFKNIKIEKAVPEEGNNSFSVQIDGDPWTTSSDNIIGGMDLTNIIISATSADGMESFTILLPADVTNGNYDLDPTGNYTITYVTPNTVYAPLSGTITISIHDTGQNYIEGSFEFQGTNGTNTISFTNGEFSVSYF